MGIFAFLWLWYSRLFRKGKTTSVSTMIKWWRVGYVGLGAFGDDGMDSSMVTTTRHKSISLSTAPLNDMASTCSHFQWTGYGTSSSSVRILLILVPLFCESLFDDICSSVVHSHTDSPFFLISPLTLYNHLILDLPLFRLPCTCLHFHRHSSYAVFFSSHHMYVPVPHPILDLHCDFSHFRYLDLYSFIPYGLSSRAL